MATPAIKSHTKTRSGDRRKKLKKTEKNLTPSPARNASRSDAGGPSLRVAGFEDEDDDEDENEAPCER
jgi:hypothetical protein